ncbi:hypothetical protein EX30DRAFT_187090 [Ascodesmis nigricans]|uniref:Uncharacterized protein n=1 Tax=Ascodesmis nigricans TaxID=341454 RepID=A0A4S2N0F6_9PEZI|nr:hypothetical protein EX30DRAFT_187090 [Ascodesmis nigricans]
MCLYADSSHPSCGHRYKSRTPIPTTRCWRQQPCSSTTTPTKEIYLKYVSPNDCRHCRIAAGVLRPFAPPLYPGVRYHAHARELDNIVDVPAELAPEGVPLSMELRELLSETVRVVETSWRVKSWLDDVWVSCGMDTVQWERSLAEWEKCVGKFPGDI